VTIEVIGLGAGGHAKVIIEILRLDTRYKIIGLLDINKDLQSTILFGLPVLGNDDKLESLVQKGVQHFFVGLGSVGSLHPRRNLYQFALAHTMQPVNVIHPTAVVAPSASIAPGVSIMPLAIVNTAAKIGENVLINSGAIVEHDCVLHNHIHIATGAKLASTVKIEDNVHIGAGAVIKQCITIGQNSIVGAGAVVLKDVPPNVVVAGVPAKIIQECTYGE
jgi:UDP-perosamine 4-acetyltransferase